MFSVDSFSRSGFSQSRVFHSRFSAAKALLASVLLLAGAALLAATPAAGQDKFAAPNPPDTTEAPNISGQVSGGIIGGVPVGGLRNNVGTGAGIRLSLAGWMDQRPVLLGLDLGFFGYGHVEEEVPFSSTVGPRVPVEVSTSNNVLETHLTARLQSRTGRFRPYAEALAGFKYLFTRTRIDEDDFGGDLGDEVASSTNFNDFALSGGVGAGVDIQVYRQDNPAKQVRRVDLHLGVQYLLGQEAEYLTEGALSDQNGNGQLDRSELDIRRSRTTFLQPTFGVTIRLADTD
ncbi:hypothetical protein GGP65_002908 [Salinibacter ruber]|uniref:hypothetical protein n=1 Tax=Salinibacter ruber TaxID=146919 RepID=UPI002167D0C1|nr:hypothetical protein [Salinibacter ruber]MCS3665265.1 hypothetical protein [Salinibacter ruber]